MTERLNISIDYCPQCRGIWLEKGKLDTIIEKSSIESNNRQVNDNRFNRNQNENDNEGGIGGFFKSFFN